MFLISFSPFDRGGLGWCWDLKILLKMYYKTPFLIGWIKKMCAQV